MTTTDSSPIETPTAYVRVARKLTDGDYGSTEVSVSAPLPVPDAGPNSQEFLQTVREFAANAKIEVLEALGVDFEVDPLTLTVQEKPKAVTHAAQAPAAQAQSNVVNAFPGAQPVAQPDQACGICGGPTFNNTAPNAKKNPKGPDYKCKNRDTCGAAMWLTGNSGGTWKP